MAFDFGPISNLFEKANKAVEWIVEEIIRKKNWLALLLLLDVVLFALFNPFQWPFRNLVDLFPQIKFPWYTQIFCSVIALIFILAVIVAARRKRPVAEKPPLKLSAIKGLLPFGFDDKEIFANLQRDRNLLECLQAISDEHWRFGVICGESGAGKTSFIQAGLWPALEDRKYRCVYVKFSDLDPFESVKQACVKHLKSSDGLGGTTDLPSLIRAATEQDKSTFVLIFDQFEQFFVHRKRKKDREAFVQSLTEWYREMNPSPVKILISIRGDFFDRLNELQKAMRYSLSPTQSFRLERFEPDQATEVFCYIAEKEKLEYNRGFISEMTRQELADSDDGLISPVDIQVLAWMVAGQAAQDDRAFNRTSFQKLGGVDGLLERYLNRALEARETESRRQCAIKVLLALTDLERNTRSGALTLESLREKLGDSITDSDLKESVAWLARGDVRLIAPLSENEEEKFELAHERIIPALRRLANRQLTDAGRANQLLDRRVNEWLGNQRGSRYLFSWPELQLIKKERRFLTWGKDRQAKEELIAASRRRFGLRAAAACLPLLLAFIGWIGWSTNKAQIYLIKWDLRNYGNNLNDSEALKTIAQSFVYSGDMQFASQIIDRIESPSSKAAALRAVAVEVAKLGETTKARSLLEEAVKVAKQIENPTYKAIALSAVAVGIAKQGETTKDRSLLEEAVKVARQIEAPYYKDAALSAVAVEIAKQGETTKDRELIEKTFSFVEMVNDDQGRLEILKSITRSGMAIEDIKSLRSLVSHFSSDAGKAKALAQILMAYSKPELVKEENKDQDER